VATGWIGSDDIGDPNGKGALEVMGGKEGTPTGFEGADVLVLVPPKGVCAFEEIGG
jgi:hypothetical protein